MNIVTARKINDLLSHANEREKHFKQIYIACNHLLSFLGAEGTVEHDSGVSEKLMSVLQDFDGGTFNEKKMFPVDEPYKLT